ncbi:MAG: Ankyrin [uncultured bacterium]|nr:MAG: Ankyrin [uncultured bacterium]
MHVLQYNHLNYSKVEEQYKKVITLLKNDDFDSAGVKKITNTPYYLAQLDPSNRLLFKMVGYNDKKYALILEVIYNHDYGVSKFLNDIQLNESQIVNPGDLKHEESITYINEGI